MGQAADTNGPARTSQTASAAPVSAANGEAAGSARAREARPERDFAVSGKQPSIVPVALSTASVFPERTTDAFEIAARLGCSRRTVARKLGSIRFLWDKEPGP